ncbi:hypothetical protein ACB098_04G100300 [Castanea mollissima]
MFGLRKSPLKVAKHNSVDTGYPVQAGSNPFDDEIDPKQKQDHKQKYNSSRKTSPEPALVTPNFGTNLFDNDEGKTTSSSLYSNVPASMARKNYRNDFRDSGGLENQSVQELENYSVYKSEETTKTVKSCLKIAEDMREDATKTLVALHQQGEQITRTHMVAADIDHDLSRGEKLLGNLGGMFSKTWKPKKTRQITGPLITRDDPSRRNGNHFEQKEKLGLTSAAKGRSNALNTPSEPTDAFQKVEVEKEKQDDALSDISSILGELKDMAIDMGSEIERQNKSLDHFYDDVDVVDMRVKDANRRARRLLGK